MVFLGQRAVSRDNNFNLIRFGAATAVLVSHAYPIALGGGAEEPLKATVGYTLGAVAVFVFFVISGFLISASFDRSASLRVFCMARVLRLVPCLVVSLLLVGLAMGPLVSSLPLADYLSHAETWTFLLRNLTLALPQYELPGVFQTNPYPAVEGSIWTLFHEVACYGMVFVLGVLGALRRPLGMLLALLAYALLWAVVLGFDIRLPTRVDQLRGLSLPFVVGMAAYVWRDRIPLHLGGVGVLAVCAALLRGTPVYEGVFILALAYATFWVAYVPKGFLLSYNRIGDYSYGLYLYAFPVQGLVVWLWGPVGPGMNMALAMPITLFLSVLSWHWVEAPALALRKRKPLHRSVSMGV